MNTIMTRLIFRKWDQASFDPDYQSMTLEEFAPMVRRIFSRKPYSLL